MKVKISIGQCMRDLETGEIEKYSTEHLCIEVTVFTDKEDIGTNFISQLEKKVNELIKEEADYCNTVYCFGCPAVEKDSYYDGFSMKKDKGCVTEQRKEIIKLFNKAKNEILKDVLKTKIW